MKPSQTQYVVGFMFDHDLSRVALIRKNKPDWQKGKLNGIGGKVEDGETFADAMEREFEEETGLATSANWWNRFATMDGEAFYLEFFARYGDVDALETKEEETVEVVPLSELHLGRQDVVENLVWLVGLAVDFLQDRRPHLVSIAYP
jgi:8-oxo-dGTP diphosphatase